MEPAASRPRLTSLDVFRGLLVALLVLATPHGDGNLAAALLALDWRWTAS